MDKKISFGFFKTKPVNTVIKKEDIKEKVEYIDCIDNKNIKLIGVTEEEKPKELIIPLINPRSSFITKKVIEENSDVIEIKQNETLEEQAARELLEEVQNKDKQEQKTTLILEIPPTESMFDSNELSTSEDYERVPIEQFGLAMLRGMGWKPTDTKKSEKKEIILRPKGVGLGVDLSIMKNQSQKINKNDTEELNLIKNAYVQIIMGKDQGKYGKVEGFDEDSGRVIVKLTLDKTCVSINESFLKVVSSKEYELKSKILNSRQFDEFVKKELIRGSEEDNLDEKEDEERERRKKQKYKKKNKNHSRSRSRSRSKSRDRERMKKHKKKERKKSRSRSHSRERDHYRDKRKYNRYE